MTIFGAATGILIMVIIVHARVPRSNSELLFWVFHPAHVFLSAWATAGMYRLHGKGKLLPTLLIGYIGSVGIATLSDSVIPYLGEWLLAMPHKEAHIGFIEKWWLVNPLAAAGIALAYVRPATKLPHFGHVFVSTWASLFHMTMASGEGLDLPALLLRLIR